MPSREPVMADVALVMGRAAVREAQERVQWTRESGERRELGRAAGGVPA